MTLTQKDKDWITKLIATGNPAASHSTVATKSGYWNPLTLTMLGICVAFLGMTIAAWYVAFDKVTARTVFETQTTATLKDVDKKLDGLEQRLLKVEGAVAVQRGQTVVEKLSKLSPKELETHRPELNQVRASLASVPASTPGFWQTSLTVVNLASKATVTIDTTGWPTTYFSDSEGLGIETGSHRIIYLSKGIKNMAFHDALVYLAPDVELQNVIFLNCVIILPVEQAPAKPIQNIGNQLLEASDLSNVTVKTS